MCVFWAFQWQTLCRQQPTRTPTAKTLHCWKFRCKCLSLESTIERKRKKERCIYIYTQRETQKKGAMAHEKVEAIKKKQKNQMEFAWAWAPIYGKSFVCFYNFTYVFLKWLFHCFANCTHVFFLSAPHTFQPDAACLNSLPVLMLHRIPLAYIVVVAFLSLLSNDL